MGGRFRFLLKGITALYVSLWESNKNENIILKKKQRERV